jgi:glycosyltransferase involved in cell wall biosynthesis
MQVRSAADGPHHGRRRGAMTPSVSIGLPVYNGERYISEAIESILGQTYTDFELIISDNASTDRTEPICLSYAAKDPRVKYSRNEKNLGAADNYNRVFEVSRGRFFKWAAHDDICTPEFVQRCVEVLEKDPTVVLCYPKSIFIDEEGKPLREYIEEVDYTDPRPHRRLRTWLLDRPGGWCNLVFGVIRSNALRQTALIGKYDSSDYILVGELALLGKLHQLPDHLFLRRDHPGRSALAHPGPQKSTAWFDSSAKPRRVYFPTWRWFGEYLKAVGRVRIGAADRVRAAAMVLRWSIRVRYRLKRELVAGARTLARSARTNSNSTGQEKE